MKKFSLLFVLVVFTSCMATTYGGTYNYRGPGNFQDFAAARYECSSGSRGQSASGYLDAYGGTYRNRPTVSCGMLDACMASKGYTRDPNGSFDASSMRVPCS